MAKKYMVRPNFWLHGIKNEPIEPNSVVELTDEQAEAAAHQVEPYDKKVHDARLSAAKAEAGSSDR